MIYKSQVAVGDDIYTIDTIRHDGGLWLVPNWLEPVGEGYMTPERIVRLDSLPHRVLGPGSPLGNYLLGEPVPEAVLFGAPTEEQAVHYQICMRPDIRFSVGSG